MTGHVRLKHTCCVGRTGAGRRRWALIESSGGPGASGLGGDPTLPTPWPTPDDARLLRADGVKSPVQRRRRRSSGQGREGAAGGLRVAGAASAGRAHWLAPARWGLWHDWLRGGGAYPAPSAGFCGETQAPFPLFPRYSLGAALLGGRLSRGPTPESTCITTTARFKIIAEHLDGCSLRFRE